MKKFLNILLLIILIILLFTFIYFQFIQDFYYKYKLKNTVNNNTLNNVIVSYYTDNNLINQSFIQDNILLSIDCYENTLLKNHILINNSTNKKYEYNLNDLNSVKESDISENTKVCLNNNLITDLDNKNIKFEYIDNIRIKNIEIIKFTDNKNNLIKYYFYNSQTNLVEKEILYSLEINKINIHEYKIENLTDISTIIPNFMNQYK